MSKRPLRRRQRRSFGAGSERAGEPHRAAAYAFSIDDLIRATADLLAGRGVFGCLWTSEDLLVTARFGRIVAAVPVGAQLCQALLPLFGMEQQIGALRRRPDRVFQIPNVAVVAGDETAPRLNITVLWMPATVGYLVLVSRALARDDLEIELTRQTRRRMLSEAQLVEQSKAIAAANVELARANHDLEAFTAIISHDLKAPMRALRYTTEDLARALADPAGGDPHEHLDRLNRQSRRMSGMLTSLLAYVRLDRDDSPDEAVDTRQLIDDIVTGMPVLSGQSITISGSWPLSRVERPALDLVLRNLIENALKHHDRPQARVLVSARPADGGIEIAVEDDGPGIPSDLQAAVFRPFTRLGDPESDGIGMGLTLVQRAVRRAGGTLQLESDPPRARGCRFTLFWPTA
ncbi:MAG: HAMP domain-containing sensor histidine kinase [Hyphomicrobiaceae bacterium]